LRGKSAAELFGETTKKEMNEVADATKRATDYQAMLKTMMQEAGNTAKTAYDGMKQSVDKTKVAVDHTKQSQDRLTSSVNSTTGAYNNMANAASKAASAVGGSSGGGGKGGNLTSKFTISTPEKAFMTPAEKAAYDKYMADEMLQMVKDINTLGFLPIGSVGRDKYGQMDPLSFMKGDVDRYLAAQYARGDITEAGLTDRAKQILNQTNNYFFDTPMAKSDMETLIRQTQLTEAMA